MAKELPYFKFEPQEWESGLIQMCSNDAKALFIQLCCTYWTRLGSLPYAFALHKHCNGIESALQELNTNDIISLDEGNIIIKFLDDQLKEFHEVSEKRKQAANKRWNNASALQVDSKSNAIREDKKREEKKKEDNKIVLSQQTFYDSLKEFVKDYSKETIRDFYNYWSEPNKSGTKIKWELERTWDTKRRLQRWVNNNFSKGSGKDDSPKSIKSNAQ